MAGIADYKKDFTKLEEDSRAAIDKHLERLDNLRSELEEAKKSGDSEAVARLEKQIQVVEIQLATAENTMYTASAALQANSQELSTYLDMLGVDVNIANITPAVFQKYVMSETLPETYLENGVEPVLILGPSENWKISNSSSSIIEIQPPYVKRVPDATPMIIDYVDAGMKPVKIEFQDGARIEALKLTPNPDTMVISSAKIINRYNTMTRWVEEHWGDDLDSINFSGSTYSFSVRLDDGENIGPGLTSIFRDSSEGYDFLKALIDIYRTNGYLYQEKSAYSMSKSIQGMKEEIDYFMVNRFLLQNPSFRGNHPRHGMIRERLYTRISFDYVTFLGYFESFDITEDSNSPYRLLYNAVFKSEKTIWTVG